MLDVIKRNQQRQIENPIFLTGYTDASFSPHAKNGGFACWLRDGLQRIILSAPTPDWAEDNNLTELCGVYGALYIGMTRLGKADIIVVKTDSQAAASWFGWQGSKSQPQHPQARKIILRAWTLAEEKSLKLIVKWVKGHQRNQSPQAFLNNQVDALARQARLTRQKTYKIESVWTRVT